ncbi:hypothetical protein L3Q82_020841 [Scortum barcoo]|uniref:Uncharacterized protein n=1 Tax=Scortum barcoo TaxID=214431 RepID=A0ACB8V8N8_9TELE|nr:hypothetical protein L3Q82_020841 [Scortum barcoo]
MCLSQDTAPLTIFSQCLVTGQTKSGSEAHHEKKNIKDRYVARIGVYQGPHPGARPGVWGSQASAWWPGLCPRDPAGLSPKWRTWARLPGEPRRPNPWNKTLAIGTWNVTSLGGRSLSSCGRLRGAPARDSWAHLHACPAWALEPSSLRGGWTLHYSGVAQGERRRAGVGLLIAPQLSRHVLEFTPVNERVASLRLRVGDRSLAVVCAYGPNSSTEYPAFLESLGGYLIVLRLGTPLFYWGTSTLTWATTVIPGGGVIGRNGLPDLNPSGVLLLDFCAEVTVCP